MTAKTSKATAKVETEAKSSGVRTYQHDMGQAEGYFLEETIQMPSLTSDFNVVDKGFTCKIDAGKVMAVRIMRPDGTMSWKKLFFPRGGTITGPIQMVDLGGMSDAELSKKAQHAYGIEYLSNTSIILSAFVALVVLVLCIIGLRDIFVHGPGNSEDLTLGKLMFSMLVALPIFTAASYLMGRDGKVDLTQTKSSQWLTKAPSET